MLARRKAKSWSAKAVERQDELGKVGGLIYGVIPQVGLGVGSNKAPWGSRTSFRGVLEVLEVLEVLVGAVRRHWCGPLGYGASGASGASRPV